MNATSSKQDVAVGKSADEPPRKKIRIIQAPPRKFSPGQLRNLLLPVWGSLQRQPEAIPFRTPVDAEALNIPDYYAIIKKPMDLSTINEKLIHGDYCNPWNFCDDIWLMFENAWTYNKKQSYVYRCANRLATRFETEIDPVMRQLGFCCGRNLYFTSLPLTCHGADRCTIPRYKPYYSYERSSSELGVGNVKEEFLYCPKCYKALPNQVKLSKDDPDDADLKPFVSKVVFKLKINDGVVMEPFVQCTRCKRLWHKICALYNENIDSSAFVCQHCLLEDGVEEAPNKFTAKNLTSCELSRFLEKRANEYVGSKDLIAGEVIIRVASCSDKELEVKPLMRERFCESNGMPEKIPYRVKEIYAFQIIDDTEVCFFSLHVQEYSSDVFKPNFRHTYISYVDSVHFFQPSEERTNLYHEILLAYMEYSKFRNFTHVHLWACPPGPGDDYIFHCHPPAQKIPDASRLVQWYEKMLAKAIKRDIVHGFNGMHQQAVLDGIRNISELPYFDGDLFPTLFEHYLKEEQLAEDARLARETEIELAKDVVPVSASCSATTTSSSDPESEADCSIIPQKDETGKPRLSDSNLKKKKAPLTRRKYQKKKNNFPLKKKPAPSPSTEVKTLLQRVLSRMSMHKDVFVVQFHSPEESGNLGPIVDSDPLISSVLMDGRDLFLARSREEHWEFSSLRRAKYSTMAITHAMHMERINPHISCKACNSSPSTTMWICSLCKDLILCQRCYERSTHMHPLRPVCLASESKSYQNSKKFFMAVQRLLHAAECAEADCDCSGLKTRIQHTRQCSSADAGCAECAQLAKLSRMHAKLCALPTCPVPFCSSIKERLRKREQALKRQGDIEMIRRINLVTTPQKATAAPSSAAAVQLNSARSSVPPPPKLISDHPNPVPRQPSESKGKSASSFKPNPSGGIEAKKKNKVPMRRHVPKPLPERKSSGAIAGLKVTPGTQVSSWNPVASSRSVPLPKYSAQKFPETPTAPKFPAQKFPENPTAAKIPETPSAAKIPAQSAKEKENADRPKSGDSTPKVAKTPSAQPQSPSCIDFFGLPKHRLTSKTPAGRSSS